MTYRNNEIDLRSNDKFDNALAFIQTLALIALAGAIMYEIDRMITIAIM